MAEFKGTVLTDKGRNLLAKALNGAQLSFTKIKLGDGLWSSDTDPNLLDDLVSPKMDLPIEDLRIVGDGTVRLRFVLTNTGLSQGFFMREIGIYAQDPDLGEILYAVAYAGDRADFIPSDGVTKVENVVDIYTVIANAQNVTAVISDTVVLATKRDIDELAETLNNLSSQVSSEITSQINNLSQQLNDTASTLSNQISTVKPEASSTAPSLVYQGKLWVDEDDLLKYFDGSNWKSIKVSFADTVDNFHASLFPAPNVIVPLNASGILDLSATYVKSNVYTFRRVDLTNATSDYMLQVGEEAIINFTNTSNVPLRIATEQNSLYEIFLQFSVNLYSGSFTYLNPNNTTYASSFSHTSVYWNSGGISSWVSYTTSDNAFKIYNQTPHAYMILDTTRRTLRGFICYEGGDLHANYGIFSSKWHSNLATWSSLGTFALPTSMSGYILIRRLI
jgi:uncharacterized protein YfcZ (UPF0381/DUF406 family)